MEINRNQILISVLETIEGISDKEYQKRVWIRGEGSQVDDFDETCCNFFGDGDPLIEHYKDFGITESQRQLCQPKVKMSPSWPKLKCHPPCT